MRCQRPALPVSILGRGAINGKKLKIIGVGAFDRV